MCMKKLNVGRLFPEGISWPKVSHAVFNNVIILTIIIEYHGIDYLNRYIIEVFDR